MKKVILILALFALYACKDTDQKPVVQPIDALERVNIAEGEVLVWKSIGNILIRFQYHPLQ